MGFIWCFRDFKVVSGMAPVSHMLAQDTFDGMLCILRNSRSIMNNVLSFITLQYVIQRGS